MEAAFDRAADLDRDGRISGHEAVAFFKGSGLPQPVLAQPICAVCPSFEAFQSATKHLRRQTQSVMEELIKERRNLVLRHPSLLKNMTLQYINCHLSDQGGR